MQPTDSAPGSEGSTLRIHPRHVGPDGIANGGYVAGLLLRELGGPAEVTLRRPTPLDHPLTLCRHGRDAVELTDAGAVLAQAVRATPASVGPGPIDFDRALDAGYVAPAHLSTPFPRCFVCGPERSAGDALRLQCGVLAPGHVAAPWIPGPAFADDRGRVEPEYVAAALDCPGGWALASLPARAGVPMLLGRIALRLDRPVRVGLPHVVVAEALWIEGRKGAARTALHDGRGTLCATALSTWISVE